MPDHEKINYLEFPAKDMGATKTFFSAVFGWEFTDYGPDYIDCASDDIAVGFYKADISARTSDGSVLVVFYSESLEKTQAKIQKSGGDILKPTFEFPGGQRFHFCDPNGNEFGVWSDK